MMRCPKCDGHGFELLANRFGRIRKLECDLCNGTGYLPTTNEEWLHMLNTEQLAEAILLQWIHGAYHGVGEFGLTDKEIESARDDIVEWLKQPHNSPK